MNPQSLRCRSGFTLTEIMIALALVSLLLVGISRIFAMASTTIGIGQGLSTAIRGQRAVGQALSTDFLGTGRDIARPDKYSGMIPIETVEGSKAQQPCIIISNFRQAAFLNEQEERNDADYNALTGGSLLDVTSRSQRIRTIDADGVSIPRYSYGVRNFRLDTFSMFTSGQFTRQTGSQVSPANASQVNMSSGLYVAPLSSTEAWVWYGHLRIFNGDLANLDYSVAYGAPGRAQTPGATSLNNKNNLYANQFRLGRMQVILKEPEDHDGNEATLPTVVGDDSLAQNFLFRMNGLNPPRSDGAGWIQPSDNIDFAAPTNALAARTPLSYDDSYCRIFAPGSTSDNHTLIANGTKLIGIESCLTDVAGVSATKFRERLTALFSAAERAYLDNPSPSANNGARTRAATYINTWQEPLFATFIERPWCNPFPSIPFDSKKMSQRSQLLSDNVTSFIVEFAGDFGTQDEKGEFTSIIPDGIIDYVAVPRGGGEYDLQTRWYGMPRDVDGNGKILGAGASASAISQSPDVIPVRDVVWQFINGVRDPDNNPMSGLPFEKVVTVAPGAGNDYLKDRSDANAETGSYTCAWGPQDFEGAYDDTANTSYYSGIYNAAGDPPRGTLKYRPLMVRVIVDMTDPQGKLAEPMTQEYIYPVRINN